MPEGSFGHAEPPAQSGRERRLRTAAVWPSAGLAGAFCKRSGAAKLQTLDLAGNNLRGVIPRNLGGPRRLRFLHLGFNQLSGTSAGPYTTELKRLQESKGP